MCRTSSTETLAFVHMPGMPASFSVVAWRSNSNAVPNASQRPNWHTYKIVAGLDRMLDQPWAWEANLVTP